VPCSDCRLCFNDERLLRERLTIGFALHGVPVTMRRARMALNDPTNPDRKLSSRVLIPRFVAAYVAEHGKEPTNRVIAEALDMNESSVWEMRKSIRTGKPARDARRGRRRR
jgi:S-adenosylmethionine:diacylglycerol 3-amino-3-carboxypropyl transferase